jgi:murein DD-endopeptidase MepM/ murein hydrolase activator NlpD
MHREPVGRLLTAALCGVLLLSGAAPTAADQGSKQSAADRILAEVRQELAESSAAMVQATVDYRLAEQALPGARQTLRDTRALLATAQREATAAAHQRGVAQTELMLASQDAEHVTALAAAQRSRIGLITRATYQSGGSFSTLQALLAARSPADFADRMAAVASITSAQSSVLAAIGRRQLALDARAHDLQEVRDRVARADELARTRLMQVIALEAQAQAAQDQVSQLVAQRRAAVAAARAAQVIDDQQAQQQQGEDTQLLSELAARARALLGAAGAVPGSSVPVQPGALQWPLHGPVTSPFGMRVHPITGVRKLHTGADLGAACGTPIRAARDGTVISAGFNTAYGWRTVVLHGVVGGALLTTTYNHQQDMRVHVGEQVSAGQVIGLVGTTGYSTGCHLHFELIVNGDFVDPIPWLA